MIQGKKILALIPARGGSKGIPGKNIKSFAGKPLIAWAIEAAKNSRYVDRVVVSTDSEEIAAIAKSFGADVPFQRPAELSTDTASSVSVAQHALRELPDFDYLLLLQPTSPFRGASDIDAAIDLLQAAKARSCVSVTESPQHPYLVYRRDVKGRLEPYCAESKTVHRRQDMPPAFMLNGAIYLAEKIWFEREGTFVAGDTVAYLMPGERSCDLDSPEDWQEAEKKWRN